MSERLQKFLARAGVASRRHAEELITAGRVSVNNQRVAELGTKVEPTDLVTVDGKLVTAPERTSWYLLHKPPGVVTTLSDPEGRPTVAGLLQGVEQRVFPVGRLDWDAEGALLLTNDGGAAHRLLHPSFEVPRTYLVKVKGAPTDETLARLLEGVRLEDGPARALRAERFETTERNTWLLLQVGEGRPHLVKRLCAAVGHPVVRLFRPAQAGISVGGLQPGELRPLTPEEVQRVEAVAAGGTVPEPAPFLPPRRHGRAGEDDEALEERPVSGRAEGAAPGPAGGARPGRGPRPVLGGARPAGRGPDRGRGRGPPASGFGRQGQATRGGGERSPWPDEREGGDIRRGPRGFARRDREAGRGGHGGPRPSAAGWAGSRSRPGAGEAGFRPRDREEGRGGRGAREASGAGAEESRPRRGAGDAARGEQRGFRPRGGASSRAGRGEPRAWTTPAHDRAPGAWERGSPKRLGGVSGRGRGEAPAPGAAPGAFRPRGRDAGRGGRGGPRTRKTPAGEGAFRPRERDAGRGGRGGPRTWKTPAGEGAFRPRERDAGRGDRGGPRAWKTPAGEGAFRPRERDAGRGGRGGPRAGEGGFRPRGGASGRGRLGAPGTGGRGRFGALPRAGGARRPRPGPRGGGGGGRGGGRR